MQITGGIRSILSNPKIYTAFQHIMGAHRSRSMFVKNFISPYPGMRILDIGCGPGDIVRHLPDVEYVGFDMSQSYIQQAKKMLGQGVFFIVKSWAV